MLGNILKLLRVIPWATPLYKWCRNPLLATVCSTLALNVDCVLERVLNFWFCNGLAWVQAMPCPSANDCDILVCILISKLYLKGMAVTTRLMENPRYCLVNVA